MWPFNGRTRIEKHNYIPPKDFLKRKKPNSQLALDETIGEVICDKCNGWGSLFTDDNNHSIQCNKCWGEGKLDWIEKATGKKLRAVSGSSFCSTSGFGAQLGI